MITQSYSGRKNVILLIIIFTGLLFIGRLFYLQVLNNVYKFSADNNVLRYITQYPSRGLIYDRDENLLVYNEAAYDLLVIPSQVKSIDTMELCSLLRISVDDFNERFDKARKYSRYKPSVFLEQISKEDYAFLEEKMYKFPGFYIQSRTLRKYPLPIASHTLGYVGEVTSQEIGNSSYYRMGDYIGKSGLEKSYENILKGRKGMKIRVVDVFNREQGSFSDGRYDTAAVAGKNIIISIDASLQLYGESLMQNKKGSIVAIEPSSGEILALVTSPTYDPNLLVGRIRSENYNILANDSIKPLLNRAIMGTYPPGSTFKIVNALIGLQEEVLFPHTRYNCDGPLSRPIKCTHYHESPLDLNGAIQHSCNPYFWNVFRSVINKKTYSKPAESYTAWYNHVTSMGFGKKFDTDIPFELDGNIPGYTVYDDIYGEGRWNALTIRSLAIGQGEILVTPLQMANFTAIIANRGWYYPPHFLRSVYGPGKEQVAEYEKHTTSVAPEHFEFIAGAMYDVVQGEHGTARWYALDTIAVCGKTGTVENPHGKDHSMFIAFAPMENPQIALSVIVENAGYGSTWAAPMAILMIEHYMTGKTSRKWLEERMLNSNLLSEN